jgi:hypothetical protein
VGIEISNARLPDLIGILGGGWATDAQKSWLEISALQTAGHGAAKP